MRARAPGIIVNHCDINLLAMSEHTLEITLIAAMDRNRLIGADGGMPWHIPGDLPRFKRLTLGKPVLMGRRTFDSIGRALPGRRNLVMTRDAEFSAPSVETVSSVDEAINAALHAGAEELMVMGGAQVYALALARATCLEITHIDATYEGDTWFPAYDAENWTCVAQQSVAADQVSPAHRFMTWRRSSP